tara:strand:+ start:877 stop:1083 length:207 start_codon:yes stop_codon:yes gene_type:complete
MLGQQHPAFVLLAGDVEGAVLRCRRLGLQIAQVSNAMPTQAAVAAKADAGSPLAWIAALTLGVVVACL